MVWTKIMELSKEDICRKLDEYNDLIVIEKNTRMFRVFKKDGK